MRKTQPLDPKDVGRIGQYNRLRDEASASSYLLPFQQEVPDLTLKVSPANVYFGNQLLEFAGGDSPEFTAPTSDPRIDILSLNSSGNLVRTAGTEDSSPVAPEIPAGNIPIAQIFNRVGQTSILEEDDSTNGYIEKDLRPYLKYDISPIIRIYEASGSPHIWNKPSGLKYIVVEMVGGGGGGGAYSGANTVGAGGGGGGFCRKKINASDLNDTENIVVGAGGLGINNSAGLNGGTSSFGSHCNATGGQGGTGGGAVVPGTIGGVGNNGDINSRGSSGEGGVALSTPSIGGRGGDSFFGGGASGKTVFSGADSGNPGQNYGGGGGGYGRVSSSLALAGGSGANGIVIVTEYYV